MKHHTRFKGLLAALVFAGAFTLTPDAQGQIIPAPMEITTGDGFFVMDNNTKIYTNLKGKDKKTLTEYLQTLPFSLKEQKAKGGNNVISLLLTDTGHKDEGYNLTVNTQGVEITAGSEAGLFYGIQSLLQLSSGNASNGLTIPCVGIKDEPRFQHRGFMLDVSRHFFPKGFILKMLDMLAYYKINVFHFHFADTGGWRIELDNYPELTRMTAFRPAEHLDDWYAMRNAYCLETEPDAYGGYYTKDEIREIIHYAALRHIQVIPEVDMPGHSRDVLCAYPHLACEGKDYFHSNELCIGKEATFEYCQGMLTEIMELFPSPYIHIGGDEANREIWGKCPDCQKRMQEEGLESVADLQNYFTNRLEAFLSEHGKTIIGWDEILDGDVSQNAVVMSWREEVDGGTDAVKRGHKVIMCPTSHCYLDYYQDCPYFEPKSLGGYTPLRQTYSFEPIPEGTEDESLVLGVQGNLWTEWVTTTDKAEYLALPRMLAIAEVGWTRPELKSYPDFYQRANKAIEYLESKGFHPFSLKAEIGSRPESEKPLCHLALGKTVDYLAPYNPEFRATPVSLTDGVFGNWNANGLLWQGFRENMDVVIDMGEVTPLRAIKGDFMSLSSFAVFLPENIQIYVSDNGEQYDLIFDQAYQNDNTERYNIYLRGWVGNTNARYIRFKATRKSQWGNIMCDEIIVK